VVALPSPALLEALERARRLGVLGPGPVDAHVAHASGFLEALAPVPRDGLVVDLGSGGGVPGLMVAEARPDLRVVLLDAMEKRTALLDDAVVAMGVADRVRVVTGRAEILGRDRSFRGTASAVTARSFGPPAATAECAAPLLQVGGLLIVSEPPDGPDRWPADELSALGLEATDVDVPGMKVLRQAVPCPERYPRRDGLPAKRPLF
jgi:16S rRNA (guanine527-N7)-methyltransferase